MKTQIVVDKETRKIICTDFANGSKHDFQLFKDADIEVHSAIKILADSGYQGLSKIHSNSETPIKKSKTKDLTAAEKEVNRALSSLRVLCENVIGMLKRFRILAEKYRNRRNKFILRFNLIAGFYNYELTT